MSTYTDAAPLLSKGVTVTKFKADYPVTVPVEPVPDVEPSKAKVTEVYNLLRNLEQSNGYHSIARMTKVKVRYVKQIHKEMLAATNVVHVAEVEPE